MKLTKIRGGLTAAQGFSAGGVHCGIKKVAGKLDMAVVFSERPTVAAGTFTTNKVKAAPVHVSKRNVRGKDVRAIIANSGNANACNGDQGMDDAEATVQQVADELGLAASQVLVCSTGRIGMPLPMTKIASGVKAVVNNATPSGGLRAAKAIMTSDKVHKEWAVECKIDGKVVRVGGIAKGAGMIDPNMATMLCFVTTDAAIGRGLFQKMLGETVGQSFNRITIDGDMSTNDTVLALANGAAGNAAIKAGSKGQKVLQDALNEVTRQLSWKIVEDGEGVSRFVEIRVKGARNAKDAQRAAESVANSQLTKCAWAGGDPNWGRILCALGYAGVALDDRKVDLFYDDLCIMKSGAQTGMEPKRLLRIAARKRFTVTADLHLGKAEYVVYTTDLTTEYVRFNQSE